MPFSSSRERKRHLFVLVLLLSPTRAMAESVSTSDEPPSVEAAESATEQRPPPPPPRRRDEARGAAVPLPDAAPAPVAQPSASRGGFYLRLSPGVAYGETRVQTDRVSQPDYRVNGPGLALDVWAGFALSSGLVLGPSLSYSSWSDGAPAVSGGAASGKSQCVLFGAFIDAYPTARRGEHFGGALELGVVNAELSGRSDVKSYQSGGLGFFVFAGYDFAIARSWSIGGLFKLGGLASRASTTIDGQNVERQATSYSASLSATLLYQ